MSRPTLRAPASSLREFCARLSANTAKSHSPQGNSGDMMTAVFQYNSSGAQVKKSKRCGIYVVKLHAWAQAEPDRWKSLLLYSTTCRYLPHIPRVLPGRLHLSKRPSRCLPRWCMHERYNTTKHGSSRNNSNDAKTHCVCQDSQSRRASSATENVPVIPRMCVRYQVPSWTTNQSFACRLRKRHNR